MGTLGWTHSNVGELKVSERSSGDRCRDGRLLPRIVGVRDQVDTDEET